MANSYTDTSALSLGKNLVQTAYDRLVEFALRSMVQYRAVVDKRPAQQSMPGSSVVFNIYQDLNRVLTPLNETVDPDAVSVPSTNTVTVTLNEWGNAALVTRKLRLFSLSDVDPGIADIIAYNMVDSLDILIRNIADVGSNAIYENAGDMLIGAPGTTAGVTATDTFKSRDARAAVTRLRTSNALPRMDELFISYIHPDVSYDLRSESDPAAWRPPHEYSAAKNIWAGAIGSYEGAEYVETPRASQADNAGGVPVYKTLFFGRQALAEAVAEEPHVIVGPVVDKLMRSMISDGIESLPRQRCRV
jgi:N4-gp56 family major capsid protein